MHIRYSNKDFEFIGPGGGDHIIGIIERTNTFYEIDLLEYIQFIAKNRKSGVVALDVGANIGNHSVFLSTFVTSGVIAIEPNPAVANFLQTNLDSNGCNHILTRCAVAAEDGAGFIYEPSPTNLGMAKVVRNGRPEATADARSTVPITTIDKIVTMHVGPDKSMKQVSIIKIDIEGMEIEALMGATQTLLQHKPHLFVEAHNPVAKQPIDTFLSKLNYVCLSRWAATPVYHYCQTPSMWTRIRILLYQFRYKLLRLVNKRRSHPDTIHDAILKHSLALLRFYKAP